jgi:hypothetical protein
MGMGGWFSGHQWGHGDFSQKFMVIYPLENELTVCELERSSMLLRTVNQLFLWPCLISMLNYQKVTNRNWDFMGVPQRFTAINGNHETLPSKNI